MRFWVSRPALERAAVEMLEKPVGTAERWNREVGQIFVARVDRIEGAVCFSVQLNDAHWLDWEGLAYVVGDVRGPDPRTGDGFGLSPWKGNWCRFYHP